MNSANHRSNQMTKMIFHRPADSRIHGLFSSRPRRLMKLWLYLRFHSQGFYVHTVKCLGVILMVSGSPAD